jgi:hypothetical protein
LGLSRPSSTAFNPNNTWCLSPYQTVVALMGHTETIWLPPEVHTSSKLTEEIRCALASSEDPPSLEVQKYVLNECRK